MTTERKTIQPEDLGGLLAHDLAARLMQRRDNDVYIEVVDLEDGQACRLRAHGLRYDAGSDSLVILAHINYR